MTWTNEILLVLNLGAVLKSHKSVSIWDPPDYGLLPVLCGAIPEQILTYCQSDHNGHKSMKLYRKLKVFIKKMHLKMSSVKWRPFFSQTSMFQYVPIFPWGRPSTLSTLHQGTMALSVIWQIRKMLNIFIAMHAKERATSLLPCTSSCWTGSEIAQNSDCPQLISQLPNPFEISHRAKFQGKISVQTFKMIGQLKWLFLGERKEFCYVIMTILILSIADSNNPLTHLLLVPQTWTNDGQIPDTYMRNSASMS